VQSASRRGWRDPALVIFLLSIPCPLPCPQDACWRRELQTHTQVCPGVLGYPPPGIQDGSEQAHIFGHILPDEIWQPQEIGTGPFPPEDTDQLGYKEQRQPMPDQKDDMPDEGLDRQADAFHTCRKAEFEDLAVRRRADGYGETEFRKVCLPKLAVLEEVQGAWDADGLDNCYLLLRSLAWARRSWGFVSRGRTATRGMG
jgi:hypothetical protein